MALDEKKKIILKNSHLLFKKIDGMDKWVAQEWQK